MTKQPLFPLADTPDVDLEQTGDANVAVDETFTAAEGIQLDSTSRAAIMSAVNVVTSGRSNSRPACASYSEIYFAYAGCAVAGVDMVRGRSDRDRDRQGLLLWRHRAKSALSDVLEPVRHLGDLSLNCGWVAQAARHGDTIDVSGAISHRSMQFNAPAPAKTNNAITAF